MSVFVQVDQRTACTVTVNKSDSLENKIIDLVEALKGCATELKLDPQEKTKLATHPRPLSENLQ